VGGPGPSMAPCVDLCPISPGKLLEPHKYATLQKLDDPNEICSHETVPSTPILQATHVCEVARFPDLSQTDLWSPVGSQGPMMPQPIFQAPGEVWECSHTHVTLSGSLPRLRSALSCSPWCPPSVTYLRSHWC
jgi:hypothetical protein